MPEWVVHLYTGKYFCRISDKVYDEINRFVDSLGPEHDVNRIIVDGHWIPEALLYVASYAYEKWGYEGLKALLHHNLLDYSKTLSVGGKYGYLVKKYGPDCTIDIIRFTYKVLDHIKDDMSLILNMLKEGAEAYDIVKEVDDKLVGDIRYPKSFLNILKRENLIEFLESLINVVDELRDCMCVCVDEVAWLTWCDLDENRRNYCPACGRVVSSSEPHVLIPNEYGERLAYKLHRECLESLKTKVNEYLRQGLREKEIFNKMLIEVIPPSIVYEVLKMTGIINEEELVIKCSVPQRLREEEEPSLREKWERLRKEVIREVEDIFANTPPASEMVVYRRSLRGLLVPMPEEVLKFYQALDMALGTVKQSVMELLKEGKEDEAGSKLKDITMKMFSNSFMVMFPTIAIVSNRRVHLDVKTFAGLSKLCDIVGIRIPFKLEWRVNELLELLDEICKRREDWVTRDWVEILRNIIEYRLHDAIYTI